jgi:long-subunit fatty acid transport protein
LLSKPATDQGLSRAALLAFACLLGGPSPARGQVSGPGRQEDLELQRSSVVLGSGARAHGMGGAFLARADDATASSWNPAGLSYLLRPELSLVGFHSVNRNDGRNAAGVTTSTDRFEGITPDFVSAAYPLRLGSRSGSVQVSYQRMLPVGGRRRIEIDEPRATTVFDLDLEGGFDVLALGTGLQVSRQFRLGVTVNRWLNGFEQRTTRYQRFVARTRYQTLQLTDFSLSAWNFNLGAIWSPAEQLNIGVVGKTPFTASMSLARRRTDFFDETLSGESVSTNAFDDDGIRVEFPWAVGFGMSFRPRSALTISADYTLTAWSEARIRNYFLLERSPQGQFPGPTPEESGGLFRDPLPYPTLNVDAPQSDTEQFRAGVEWVLIHDRFKLPLRAGYYVDRQYFLARNGPPPRFHGFTVGTGILTGPLLLDFAYVLERGNYPDRESLDRVVHRSNRLWVSLIYRHGAGN